MRVLWLQAKPIFLISVNLDHLIITLKRTVISVIVLLKEHLKLPISWHGLPKKYEWAYLID